MGNLHVILAVSLDGYVAATDGSLDWIIMGDERADYMVEAVQQADTLLMGRKTYTGFSGFWPHAPDNPDASAAEKAIGAHFNSMRKIVFSRTLTGADWGETSIKRQVDPAEIELLKRESVSVIRLDGSISIVQEMTRLGLIDEYRLMVHPVALGDGRPLFTDKVGLELTRSEAFKSGVVVLTYRPAGNRPVADLRS